MIIYKDVLKRLSDAGYNTGVLFREHLLSQSTLKAIRHNTPVSTKTIDIICKLAGCQPGDILEYRDDEHPTD